MIKVGINGFGRIGRMVFRAAFENFSKDIEIVGINDLLDPEYLAYMLKYDSVHGRFNGEVSVEGNFLVVNGQKIRITAEKDPANLKWDEVQADVVVESTGFFLTEELASAHLKAGAKKVIMSAPSKDATPMFVYGVNDQDLCRSENHLERFLHDQLLGSHLEGSQRQVRYQARLDDDCPRCNRYPENG